MYKPSEKNEFNRVDNHKHWPASIKNIMQWFPFLTIMEHTENEIQEDKGLISLLLKMFSMFEIRLSFGDDDLDALAIKCINCKRETDLNSETSFTWVYDEIVTKFVLNAMLHNFGMSWIISSNREMNYEMNTKINHLDWLNKGTWYNKKICSKLHGSRFDNIITQARTDRYNLICSLVAHDRLQLYYKDYEISIGDMEIPNDATIKTLESLGATYNFIYIWLKLLRESFCAESESYINAMKEMSMKITQNVERSLTSKEKNPKMLTDICGG